MRNSQDIRNLKEIAERIRHCHKILSDPKCHCGIMGCIACGDELDAEREMYYLIRGRGDFVADAIEASCADTFCI